MNKAQKNIVTMDCHYVREKLTASYLIKGPGDSGNVIIETGHPGAVKHILAALKENNIATESISHIMITHVHLDHSGGVAGLVKSCPNARVVCHPRARLHLIDPERLVKGSKVVYGEPLFNSLYGKIDPVSDEKIIPVQDGETLEAAGTTFSFLHTEGHARHHICIHDTSSRSIFTGDTFGMAYPDFQIGSRKFIYPATTPSDFDISEARKSIQRILDLGIESVWLTHYGNWSDVQEGAEQIYEALDEIEKIQIKATQESLEGEDLREFCYQGLKKYILNNLETRGLTLSPLQWKIFDYDVKINASGISWSVDKARKKIDR
ncbi:MAG: MBL fold metallo-hydrolase [Spirochaetia bacterium]|nr:MBL fold metallo-hydrolase [Spirochaetia bacterium]